MVFYKRMQNIRMKGQADRHKWKNSTYFTNERLDPDAR